MNFAPDLFSRRGTYLPLLGSGSGCGLSGRRRGDACKTGINSTRCWALRSSYPAVEPQRGYPGLNLHLLGAMAHPIFGPQLALVVLALALAGITLNGSTEWGAYPINLLVMAVVRFACRRCLSVLVGRWLPSISFISSSMPSSALRWSSWSRAWRP